MGSQVSGEGEVELKCFRVFEISKASPPPQVGRPTFPFIDQEKDLGYMGEREVKRQRGRGPRGHVVLLLLQAGPCWSCR
jgi:hypothetical protein